MYKCEICGKEADIHHIVHKSEGGLDFPANYKYLCSKHHRGKYGPHRDNKIDITYKLELQENLDDLLYKEFFSMEELILLLGLNKSKARKLFKDFRLYKEGFKKSEIIFRLMGKHCYNENMLDDYIDMMVINI